MFASLKNEQFFPLIFFCIQTGAYYSKSSSYRKLYIKYVSKYTRHIKHIKYLKFYKKFSQSDKNYRSSNRSA